MRRRAGPTRLTRFVRSRLAKVVLLGVVTAFIVAAGLFTVGLRLESNDRFCASCHLEPETSYFQASLNPDAATTLAAFHAGVRTRCINCHSRRWIPGRVWAQWGGLQNLLAYWSGDFTRPNATTRPVGDGGCSKCHSDFTWVIERPGHYHSPLLRRRWRSADGPANTCEACHPSHQEITPAADRFMRADLIELQCTACHDATGAGR